MQGQQFMTLRSIRLIAPLLLLTASLMGLVACTENKLQFKSIDITGADYARDFAADGAMLDHDGKPRAIRDFAGKIVVVFFGYTQCPDVCPTTMSELVEVKKLLGKDGDKVVGLFITVDPARDTPEVLKAYTANFSPDFLGLTASSPEALAKVVKEFKIYYKKVPGKTETSYTIDHTAASYVFDTQGKVRLYTRYGSGAPALAADIKQLLK
jgi:protein SCO1/2